MPTKNEIAATMTRGEAAKMGVVVADSPAQVQEIITSRSKNLFGFTRKVLPPGLPVEPRLYIRSISTYGELTIDLGPGFVKYRVDPCPEGEPYGPACVIDCLSFLEEAKVDVTEFTPHTGQQIADAIMKLGPGMNASNDRRRMGWFMSPNETPTEEELSRALTIYTEQCQKLLAQGNRYAASNQLTEINEEHRRAATFLRQKVDWDKRTSKMVDCPGCGEPVKEGVIWHATPHGCGYIFNQEEYSRHFEAGRPKKGRPVGT